MAAQRGQTQAEAGIRKRISEPVYPADPLSDDALQMCTPAAKGGWCWCLFHMWRDRKSSVRGSFADLGRMWGCGEAEAETIVDELRRLKVCRVMRRNGNVMLTCRRLARREKDNKENAERVRRHRAKRPCNGDVMACNGDVMPMYSAPSSLTTVVKEVVLDPPNPPKPPSPPSRRRGGSERNQKWKTAIAETVIMLAPVEWRQELAKEERIKVLIRYEPLIVAATILDLRNGRRKPKSAEDAIKLLQWRLREHKPPSQASYDAAKVKLEGWL